MPRARGGRDCASAGLGARVGLGAGLAWAFGASTRKGGRGLGGIGLDRPRGRGAQARPEREAAEARAEAAEVAPRAAAARSAVVVPVTEEEAARRPGAAVLAAEARVARRRGRRWRWARGRFNRSRCDILRRRRRLSLGLFGRLRLFGRRRRSFRGRGFRLNIDDHFVRRFGRFRLQRDDRERGDVERDDESDDERAKPRRPNGRQLEGPPVQASRRSRGRRVWRRRSRRGGRPGSWRDRSTGPGHDRDPGDSVCRELVHHRDDVAIRRVAIAAQLYDAIGITEPGLDRRRQLIGGTWSLPTETAPSFATTTTTGFLFSSGWAVLALGRLTLMPLASIGAVTMKMIRSTSITSTSGVTLISANG